MGKNQSKLFAKISGYRTMVEKFPEPDTTNSIFKSALKPNADQIEFITDLFAALGDAKDLQNSIIRIIVETLPVIETTIKTVLKSTIRDFISCNVNPSILDDLKTNGIWVTVDEIDLMHLLRKHPSSSDAGNFYFDTGDGTDASLQASTDFNVFLWYVTHIATSTLDWKKTTPKIAKFTFHETIQNHQPNSIQMLVNGTYNSLIKFNDDYIDSIKLFDKEMMIKNLMMNVFGITGPSLSKSRTEQFLEEQVKALIDKIGRCPDVEVDDSFFTFSTEAYTAMLDKAELQKSGDFQYSEAEQFYVKLSPEEIKTAFNGLDTEANEEEQKTIIDGGINKLVDSIINNNPNASQEDKQKLKLNIIKQLIQWLSIQLMMLVMSPKIFFIILANLRMLGIKDNYDAITFIKTHFNLVARIVSEIKDALLKELFGDVMKLGTALSAQMMSKMLMQQAEKYRSVLRSLTACVNRGSSNRNTADDNNIGTKFC
jgi:hypothetical protein